MRLMHRDSDDQRVFTRRTLIFGAGVGVLFATVAARLYKIQITDWEYYNSLAEDNRINRRLLAPVRGNILDRFGRVVAGNDQNYRIVLIPEQTADDRSRLQIDSTLNRLSNLIHLSERTRKRIHKEARNGPKFRPILVAEGLSWAEFARVNVLAPDLPGIQPEIGERRDYPFEVDMAHIVGYVGRVSEDDIKRLEQAAYRRKQTLDAELKETLRLPTFRIGKNGIEGRYDDDLRGNAGARQVEVNAFGREIKEINRIGGRPGSNVHLTIDAELQSFAMARVQGESAAVVVMDIHTGDVLALASAPGFDPNPFGSGLSTKQWEALRDNEFKPLVNKTIAGQYPPGSTFKMVTALAALDSGAIRPEQTFFCGGRMNFGGRRFHCWRKQGHGWMDLHQGIKKSCDIYFYEIAHATGIEQIAKTARALGLGSNYDFALPGAKSGLVPDNAWKISARGEPWYAGETLNIGIGQGFLLTTPLQLAVYMSRLSNGGHAVEPRIVRTVGQDVEPPKPPHDLGFKRDHIRRVLAGMNGVSNEVGGTAFRSRITEAGFELAGKTGTAQVRRISTAERASGVIKNADLPWKLRDHALFVAFAPYDKPRYAVSVVVEHGGSGSRAAAPIGRDVLLFAQQRDPLARQTFDPLRAQYFAASNRSKTGR